MKFLVDAQLPYKLANYIKEHDFDTIHTDDMLNHERTTDSEIGKLSDKEERIVVTKDLDFFDSYILKSSPKKLLWISTGNIKNKVLIKLFEKNFKEIIKLFRSYNLVELNNEEIIGYE